LQQGSKSNSNDRIPHHHHSFFGFEINLYNPCVANRIIKGKQHTVSWHVDDLKSSKIDSKVNNKFLAWSKTKYANDKIGEIKAVCGMKHDYLAMMLDFTTPGVLKLNMTLYVKKMLQAFPIKFNGNIKCPWNKNLLKVDKMLELSQDRTKLSTHL
jgi:hypothetical protein